MELPTGCHYLNPHNMPNGNKSSINAGREPYQKVNNWKKWRKEARTQEERDRIDRIIAVLSNNKIPWTVKLILAAIVFNSWALTLFL